MFPSLLAMGQAVADERGDWASGVVPLLKLLCLTVIGSILAHPKTQIVPKATFKLLSKLVFALFLPCLIFVRLGESVTLEVTIISSS
jgi:auxin efflux carrier family protein